MQTSRLFKTSEFILAKTDLMSSKGVLYLEAGGEAQVMIYDPVKHPEAPYGIRKPEEHTTTQFFSEDQLMVNPNHKKPVDVWDADPTEYYKHPENPKHELYRATNWYVDPASI